MRSNLLFILGLIGISCVISTTTTMTMTSNTFLQQYNENIEFQQLVDQLKTESQTGSMILTLAEIQAESQVQGRFTPLFEAIDQLSAFLVQARNTENRSFAEATRQFHSDVNRLRKARNLARKLYEADVSLLNNKLYPRRAQLQRYIARLQKQLASLKRDLAALEVARQQQIKVYKQRSADYVAGIAALQKALPYLKGLRNGQSFAQLDSEVFVQVSAELKQSLGKLEMGQLYTAFVESMMEVMKPAQNFVNQEALNKVIGLISNLKDRLQKGLIALNNDEAVNVRRYKATKAALQSAIRAVQNSLTRNIDRLKAVEKKIVAVEKHRNQQLAAYRAAVAQLRIVRAAYVRRTAQHKQLLTQISQEETIIAKAVNLLVKANITRSSS